MLETPEADGEGLGSFAAVSLLALIQGLTEFLPVSSSGHLVLTQHALGLEGPVVVIDVALHLGTLLAVVVAYRRDLLEIARDAIAGRLREVGLLAVGSVPAAAVGLGMRDVLGGLFEAPRAAATGLLATAAILTVGELARRRRPDPTAGATEPTWGQALLVGLAQALAILPGISRSGTTIAVGTLLGLAPRAAARFSFLLAIPAILGAAAVELPAAGAAGIDQVGAGTLAWAGLFAGFVGWGALRMLLAFLGRGAFAWFAVYCLALGVGYLAFA